MKKLLSIILTILMIVTMLPMAFMPASAAYEYDDATKLSFKITNLVREWNGETKELGESGSAFYEQSLTKVADGKYKYTYKAALATSGGTWWSDPKTVTFDGVDCESDYYKTFEFTESTHAGGYTMTWTYTLEVKRYKGHTYGAWSDNGDGTHTRTCVINSAHKETASHNYAAATCSAPETCKNCGATQGEPVADAHGWNAATCVLPQTCKYCGITQGEVLGHNMVAATFGKPAACSRCGATDINISVLEVALINTNVNLPSKAVKDDNAGYNDITWSVVDAGSTGATINGSTLKASYSGEALIRATIESDSKDFTVLFKSSENIDISLGSVIVSKKDASTLTVAYAGFEGGSKDYMVGEPIQIAGTTTSNFVQVSSGSATVILNNVSISRNEYCFRINGGATADLTLVGSNALSTGSYGYAALSVPDNAAVTIGGEGTLTATSPGASAAIGSGNSDNGTGTIVINGGTIIAKNTYTKGKAGAGIGGGIGRNGDNIIINGGVVTATGGRYAAGIGGGSNSNGGQITINGGIVTATGGQSAAGIGGGQNEYGLQLHGDGGQITITGGTVIANGGGYGSYFSGAGIGGGYKGNGGTVVITGGNIKATAGSSNAEAIGKGGKGESSGTIKDGNGNDLSLQTITLSGTAANTAVTATDGITYGLTDVKTVDTNRLYFYLPADTAATSITAGGTVYDCVVGLTYYPGHSWVEATCSTAKTCTNCGLTEGEALGHNMVDGKCDCGYECTHEWDEGVLTRPHQNDDNTWSDGYYTYTCKNGCGATTTETVKRADYTAFDEAEAELEYWFQLPYIIPSVIEEYKEKATDLIIEGGLRYYHTAIETEQNLIDELTDGFNILNEELARGYANGTFLKVNLKPFEDAEAIEEELAAKYGVEAVLSITISDRIFERFDEIYNEYYVIRDNENATALEYNDDIRRLAEGLTAIYAELEFCIQGVHNVETWSDNGENHIGDCISCTATGITAEHTDADGDKLCDSGCGHNFEKPEESFKPSLNAQTNADGSQIRFITCVDSLNYKEVGFVITNANNKEQTTTKISKTVYNSIVAGGKKLTAADITGDEGMKYILTYTVKNLPEDAAFEVTSFVVNLDGTKIYGETETYTVADMLG